MKPVLLTVSGTIPAELAAEVQAGRRPRADYVVMAQELDAELIDVPRALASNGTVGRLLLRVAGPGALLAWHCFRVRRRYEVLVTDGEQVGVPLALLCRILGRGGARHVMIVHILSTTTKERIVRWARLAPLIDRYVVYSSWQRDYIIDRFGVPAADVVLTSFMVDTAFFDPRVVAVPQERMICAVGLERRDYPTLMTAVEGLDVRVVVAAASPWSTQPDSTSGREVPDNVEVKRFDLFELRELYARSLFVVMPLVDVPFQAGITAILEAMAMERAVVCTRTAGQTDTIIEGETGRYVPPRDPVALRAALQGLLDDTSSATVMGAHARAWAIEHADVEQYAQRLGRLVGQLR